MTGNSGWPTSWGHSQLGNQLKTLLDNRATIRRPTFDYLDRASKATHFRLKAENADFNTMLLRITETKIDEALNKTQNIHKILTEYFVKPQTIYRKSVPNNRHYNLRKGDAYPNNMEDSS